MAEVVDIVREYSKEFIMYPINERLDKMENYFKLKLEQMEQLINDNIHKSNQMNTTLETIQTNELKNINEKLIKLEGNNEFIFKANEEKHQNLNEMFNQREIKLNSIINHFEESLKKLSKDFSHFEAEVDKENKKLNESFEIDKMYKQLQLDMKNKDEDNQKKFEEIDKKLRKVECEENQMKKVLFVAATTIDKQELEINYNKEDNCKTFQEIDRKIKVADDTNLLKLKSLKNSFTDQSKKVNKVLFAAVTTTDNQREMLKGLKAITTDKSNKVDQLQDEIKDIKSRLGLVIREYSKEFIMYPINERLDKMENYIKLKLEHMEQLINDNIHKSNQMDRTLETIPSNDLKNINKELIKLEGNNEFIFKANEEKHEMFNQKEIKWNIIINHFEESLKKLSKDFTDFELEIGGKNKKLNESVKQLEITSQEINEEIEMIKSDSQQNSTLLNENIKQVRNRIVDVTDNLQYEIDRQCQQLQMDMRNKFEEIDKEFKKVECEKKEMNKILFIAATTIDKQQLEINNNEKDNCNKFEGVTMVSNGISSELISFKNCYEEEKSELNKGLNAAVKTIDDQSEILKGLTAATTDQSVNGLGDQIKDIKSRLGIVSQLYCLIILY
ncbi:hypothetical protein CHUAL_010514 [Chamberlinius hualienensis]